MGLGGFLKGKVDYFLKGKGMVVEGETARSLPNTRKTNQALINLWEKRQYVPVVSIEDGMGADY